VTAAQRRQAVRQLQQTFGVSQRRACRVLGQARSTQRLAPKTSQEEERLVRRILELVRQRPRWGYRRITVLLRREGWRVNRKRVYQLWRQQGLKVPRKQRKKRRLGHSGNSCVRRPAGAQGSCVELGLPCLFGKCAKLDPPTPSLPRGCGMEVPCLAKLSPILVIVHV